jgi:hypothetical protein
MHGARGSIYVSQRRLITWKRMLISQSRSTAVPPLWHLQTELRPCLSGRNGKHANCLPRQATTCPRAVSRDTVSLCRKFSYLRYEKAFARASAGRATCKNENASATNNPQRNLNPIPRSAKASRNFPGIPESVSVNEMVERLAKLSR